MHKSYYIVAWHADLEKSVRPNFSPLEHVVNNPLFFLVSLSVMFDNLLMYEAHENSMCNSRVDYWSIVCCMSLDKE
jgi:hypothetical protein